PHFVPTSSSWMNLVERWFGHLDNKAIKRAAFLSVADLKAAIAAFLNTWKESPKPFVWTATIDSIQEKLSRCRRMLEQIQPGCTTPKRRKPRKSLPSYFLDTTLARLGVHPSFKRSRLVTACDLQTHNVIFLGAPSVNPILNELPPPPGFGFAFANARPFLWRTRIKAVKPASGEPAQFVIERDPESGVLRTDYATVSLLPGIAPGRRILVLAGLTTSGTQAAAEVVTSAPRIDDLLKRVGSGRTPGSAWQNSFQSVWRVDLSRGLDVIQSTLVSTRTFEESPPGGRTAVAATSVIVGRAARLVY
ncbi:MAG: hypothetical protein M3Y57_23155, partial [Acidobacteriota bacterium]|nr:hypothetical protein [Acidobacteriota bacterium]